MCAFQIFVFVSGITLSSDNNEMCCHYMQSVKTNFLAKADLYGNSNEVFAGSRARDQTEVHIVGAWDREKEDKNTSNT